MASTSTSIPVDTHSTASLQGVSGTTVRTNGLMLLRGSWQSISRASKLLLLASVFFTLAQVAVSAVILGVFSNQSCDRPVQTYLIVYAVRLGLVLPLIIYQHLSRNTRRTAADRSSSRPARRPPASASASSHQPSTSSQPQTHAPARPVQQQQDQTLKEWCDRLRSLFDLFGILWFIVGNYILFTTQTCAIQARPFYFTILTWVLLNYIVILIPVFICVSVIFCLPCVLVILRLFHVQDVPGVTVGASQEEIQHIPVYKFKQIDDPLTSANPSFTTLPAIKKPSWLRSFYARLLRQKPSPADATSFPSLRIAPQEDAMCSICLSEYEPDDLLCKLWCGHHFHKDCVHEWLALNPLCPLCKQDFRGKEHVETQDTDEEAR
ncbi:hypothetical protein DM01DRAFT_1411679 [Hesseltinella vesiculosa]|uniref:RING-type domain-containing protein n=1 Tax=Hesseltinella vesiculosa TaxID=101127 RepID=A0A1X2G2Q5_9FUNG|nr:hypothetical protein DM01DRAFT_1411679 [Hesseltinella vesiculosa]